MMYVISVWMHSSFIDEVCLSKSNSLEICSLRRSESISARVQWKVFVDLILDANDFARKIRFYLNGKSFASHHILDMNWRLDGHILFIIDNENKKSSSSSIHNYANTDWIPVRVWLHCKSDSKLKVKERLNIFPISRKANLWWPSSTGSPPHSTHEFH